MGKVLVEEVTEVRRHERYTHPVLALINWLEGQVESASRREEGGV